MSQDFDKYGPQIKEHYTDEWTWFSMVVRISCITSTTLDKDSISDKVCKIELWCTMAVDKI